MKHRILLVEDDAAISEMVRGQFTREGFEVVPAFDGEEALEVFANDTFDLILLDLMLPKLDGMEFLKIIRGKSMIPVLIMSAKDGDLDKALGLGFGADDYIAKPFSMIELTARVKAAIRRATHYSRTEQKQEVNVLTVGELTLDLDNFSLLKNGSDIKLTAKEFHILKLFISHPSRVYTKAQIYSLVWEDEYYGDENVINVHMRRLREKIEDDPSKPKYIKTLWGIGYKLGEF
ncbi:response regulator transcription factor [Neobacillus sp. MM2021_6]|uniref:response regulator transcription factor n=1 Tax=Bacillaceae TaxID=186817 RepID=UPI00140D15A2|nr:MULTISPECIES: response regulator transcription factor [Bacillaceae]MBO0959803.1 response regulator transcription factor [Neobacillus sp. MM2021_6]NHC20105.1 response regulator transcription factor [Bacillus sp. MM2020_4]